MAREEVVEALRRYVLRPDEPVEKVTDGTAGGAGQRGTAGGAGQRGTVLTSRRNFDLVSPDWLVRRESWVRDALLVRHDADAHGTVYRYGFVWTMGGEVLFLNSVETMAALGRRLDAWAEPLGLGELLAEFHYSVHEDGEATVYPFWEARLIHDPAGFIDRYPSVYPSLVRPPRVDRDGTVLEFCSYYRYLLDYLTTGVDILSWTVTGAGGRPATWTRHLVAEGVREGS